MPLKLGQFARDTPYKQAYVRNASGAHAHIFLSLSLSLDLSLALRHKRRGEQRVIKPQRALGGQLHRRKMH